MFVSDRFALVLVGLVVVGATGCASPAVWSLRDGGSFEQPVVLDFPEQAAQVDVQVGSEYLRLTVSAEHAPGVWLVEADDEQAGAHREHASRHATETRAPAAPGPWTIRMFERAPPQALVVDAVGPLSFRAGYGPVESGVTAELCRETAVVIVGTMEGPLAGVTWVQEVPHGDPDAFPYDYKGEEIVLPWSTIMDEPYPTNVRFCKRVTDVQLQRVFDADYTRGGVLVHAERAGDPVAYLVTWPPFSDDCAPRFVEGDDGWRWQWSFEQYGHMSFDQTVPQPPPTKPSLQTVISGRTVAAYEVPVPPSTGAKIAFWTLIGPAVVIDIGLAGAAVALGPIAFPLAIVGMEITGDG